MGCVAVSGEVRSGSRCALCGCCVGSVPVREGVLRTTVVPASWASARRARIASGALTRSQSSLRSIDQPPHATAEGGRPDRLWIDDSAKKGQLLGETLEYAGYLGPLGRRESRPGQGEIPVIGRGGLVPDQNLALCRRGWRRRSGLPAPSARSAWRRGCSRCRGGAAHSWSRPCGRAARWPRPGRRGRRPSRRTRAAPRLVSSSSSSSVTASR